MGIKEKIIHSLALTSDSTRHSSYQQITMRLLVIFVIVFNFNQGGFAQEGAEEPIKCGKCEPCICREIPGLVYDEEENGCAWPDEVGCKLSDLGFAASCDGEEAGVLKAVDFEMPYLPEGTAKEQYFVVCVPESTPADIQKRKNQRTKAYFLPSGPIVPRLLGCPDGAAFSGESMKCEGDGVSLYDNYPDGEVQVVDEYDAEIFK